MDQKNAKQANLRSFFTKGPAKPKEIQVQDVEMTPAEPAVSKENSDLALEGEMDDSDEEIKLPRRKKQKIHIKDEDESEIPKEEDKKDIVIESIAEINVKKSESDDEFEKEIEVAKEEEKEQAKEEKIAKEAAKTLAVVGTSMPTELSWAKGKPIPYAMLCKTFERCEATTKRLAITEYLVQLFLQAIKLTPDGLLELLYMCINKLCPDYEGLEMGVGESFLIKAIVSCTGRNIKSIKAEYRSTGDLGTVAMSSKSSQGTLSMPKPLTVHQVFQTLKDLSQITGNQSQKKKIDKINSLLVQCRGSEAKYLIRQLEGKLRIGLAEQTVLSALAQSIVLSKPETSKLSQEKREEALADAAAIVKSVYNQLPCYDMIIPALLTNSIKDFPSKCKMRPGIPLKPMLAHPTKSLTEILDRFENSKFTCEFKYDGERAQIHLLPDGRSMVYSRNSENMSDRYPDIMSKLANWVMPTTTSFILDCEAVAWDKENKQILPFQVLSTRKRKDVKEEDIKIQVAVFAFDCLYLNGESLLRQPLEVRREKLRSAFKETENEFYFARQMDSNNIDDIQVFLDVSIENNCEGLMVKLFDGEEASYEPSKRSRNWLKVKKDYLSGIGDSMDLVVIGAFYGRGKRTSVYGAFLLACYDPETEEYQTICKIGTGFSEEDLLNHYNALKDHVIEAPKRFYCLGENPVKPDVWFEPVKVWEVLCADLSISPRYMAAVGKVDAAKGISLRFPRFIRVRDDKGPEDSTSSEQVMTFYYNQANSSKGKGDDMDY